LKERILGIVPPLLFISACIAQLCRFAPPVQIIIVIVIVIVIIHVVIFVEHEGTPPLGSLLSRAGSLLLSLFYKLGLGLLQNIHPATRRRQTGIRRGKKKEMKKQEVGEGEGKGIEVKEVKISPGRSANDFKDSTFCKRQELEGSACPMHAAKKGGWTKSRLYEVC
jgi:hypothetical protein